MTYNYTYDKVGNRLSKSVDLSKTVSGLIDSSSNLKAGKTTYKYNENNQLVSEECSGEKTEYSYDDNGNLISVTNGNTVQSYEYNYQNKLSVYKNSAGKEFTYSYDAQGNRISKSSATGVIKYVVTTFDDLSNVILELDKDNKQIKHYTIGEDLLGVDISGTDYSYIQDGHGDVAFLTDSNGEFVNKYAYDAFGNSLICSEKVSNSFRYNSENYDEESGLYYLRARYMNPATGTFTQEDTYQGDKYDAISLHKYLFAAANPVVFEDATGNMFSLSECSICTAINNTIAEYQKLNSVRKLIKFVKTATVIVESINIIESIQKIIAGEPWYDVVGDIASIVNSIVTIITITQGISISGKLNFVSGIVGIISDSKDVVDGIKEKNVSLITKGVASVILDIIFLRMDFKENNFEKVSNTINKEKQNLMYDISLEAILNGGLTELDKSKLMSMAYDFDYDAEVWFLFNRSRLN